MSRFGPNTPAKPRDSITLAGLFAEVRDGAHRDAVGKVRTAVARNMDPTQIKKALPAVTLSGAITEGGRGKAMEEGRFDHNGLLQVDIDAKENPGIDPEEVRDQIANDPHIVCAFLSPTGEGVKGIMLIPPCATHEEHVAFFRAMQEHMRRSYGLKIDDSTKDPVRLFFVSYDPEAKWNDHAVPFAIPAHQDAPQPPAAPKVEAPPANGGLKLSERFGAGADDWTLDDLDEMLSRVPAPPKGHYQVWIDAVSGAWNTLGEAATPILMRHWPEWKQGDYTDRFPTRESVPTILKIYSMAKNYGWKPSPRQSALAARGLEKTKSNESPPPTPDVFRAMLRERAFDAANPPPRPVPVLMLNDKCIGTPGNILALQAGFKAGKTAALGGINAAFFIERNAGDHDTLGFTADNPEGHAVLHFDTEQSRYDHDGTIRRALSRAGLESPPEWFRSYSVADLPQGNRVYAMETAIEDALADFGGIRAIILDGVADFMRDPNNPEESFALVDKLHQDAIRLDCLIVAVIHENPGSETGKTRGHLGSQLQRKAETNLQLAKDKQTGISTMWADFARHCHIPKDAGTCFAWCDKLGRHVSKGTAREIKASAKQQQFREEAEAAFGDVDTMSYSALVAAIMAAVGMTSKKTAEKRVTTYQTEGIITKNGSGSYSLK